ncbi:MAG: winged helix-turn-helix transcriptional regulator [Promethearchaeota archaeon]
MTLTYLDFKMLQLIELHPQITVQELAKRLDITWVTAREHLKQLKRKGILAEPIAVFNPDHLGLERHVVIFKVHTENQIIGLEHACDIHPYTHYRSRIYGPFAGVFAQFDIPSLGNSVLQQFFEHLQEMELFDEILLHKSTGYRRSTVLDLQRYNPHTMVWTYNWQNWMKAIREAAQTLPPIKNPSSTDNAFSFIDLQILRELTARATIKQTEIRDKFSLTKSTTSRKIKFIFENYIESIRAQIRRAEFNVIATKFFYCLNAKPQLRNQLFNAFAAPSCPPFPLSIDLLEENGVSLWGRMPPTNEYHLFYTLWEHLPSLQVFTMDTVGSHSRLYWFYPENYDSEASAWRVDKDYVIDTPLKMLKRKLNSP